MTDKLRSRLVSNPLVGSIAALLLCSSAAHAVVPKGGTAYTWLSNPQDGDWNNSNNWNPNGTPGSYGSAAIFNTSKVVNIGIPDSYEGLDTITFNPNASAYNILVGYNSYVELDGLGIVNNSGKTQNFTVGRESTLDFYNKATIGKDVTIVIKGGSVTGGEGAGYVHFWNQSSAGEATIIAQDGGEGGGGHLYFMEDSQGGTATIKLYGKGQLDISSHNPGSVTIGSLEGNGLVFLGSNNLTIGSNNKSTVFSGIISDGGEGAFEGGEGSTRPTGLGGSLTKIGIGSLTLTGANTYTGNTNVNGGKLIIDGSIVSPFTFVNPGGTLGGHGFIGGSVINNGFVSPGNSPGTLTILSNYTQGSGGTLVIQIASPNVFDKLVVGGAANLNGTVQVEPLNGAKLKKGQQFEFLTAGGGIYGTFSNLDLVDNDTLMRFKLVYGSHDVSLEAFVAPFSSLPGLTPNQQALANALDKGGSDKLINFLANEPISKLPGDLDKLAPEEYTSMFNLVTSFDSIQSLNIQQHTDSLRSGTPGFSAGGLALNGFNVNYNGPIQFRTGVAGPNGNDGKGSKEVQAVAPAENRWGAFLVGTGQWVGVQDDYNAKGYDIANGGFTLGIDYKLCSHAAVGLMAGYVGTGVDTNDGGRTLANGGKLGIYATVFENRQPAAPASTGMSKDSSKESKEVIAPVEVDPGWYADVAVVGGYTSYDIHRAALNGTARGDTDGGDLNVLFGAGYDFKRGGFTFGPTASFNYTYVGVGSFSESGSLAPLHFGSQSQESIKSSFGLKASYDWKLGGLLIKPEVRAAWQHEYGDSTYTIDSSFASGGAGDFTVSGPRIGRDSLLVGAGFAIQVNERCSTYFYYDGELARTRYDSHAVTGGLRVAF
ncbi:MAG: autotransporter domain-containing protein [Chthoniobacter sp.]